MKDKVYVFQTHRQALCEWLKASRTFSDFFVKANRSNLTLTSITGRMYYFRVNTQRELLGLKAEIIIDEFVTEDIKKDIKNELLQLPRKSKTINQ